MLDRIKRAFAGVPAQEEAQPEFAPAQQDQAIEPIVPQSIIAVPHHSPVNRAALRVTGLRRGMWVTIPSGEVGILTGCSSDGIAEVTLTKRDGSTVMTLDANDKAVLMIILKPIIELRQALVEEIPESRRPSLNALLALGYEQRAAK